LVIMSLRTAHEAGWLNAGQQPTVNLSWLVAPGTIQSALITGLLGIPADPRLIEVIGWLSYLIPVALFIYWPPARRPQPRSAAQLRLTLAAALAVLALGLAILYPNAQPQLPAQVALVATAGTSSRAVGTARLSAAAESAPAVLQVSLDRSGSSALPLPESKSRHEDHDGIKASAWVLDGESTPARAASTLTLDEVVALSGGRMPVGLNPRRHPGPFAADWSTHRSTSIWTADGVLLDAAERSATILTISGSGLQTPRTLTVDADDDALGSGWRVSPAYLRQAVAELNAVAAARTERQFWAVQLPVVLAIVGLILAGLASRTLVELRRTPGAGAANHLPKTGRRPDEPTRGARHVTH
jgi:high-affinity iron transporter